MSCHETTLAAPGAALRDELPHLPSGELARVALLATAVLAQRGLAALLLWRRRSVTRAALDELDARLLRDIGLTREQARRETRKWFWQG